ncbi:MAG: hypothetical protein OJJ55_16020 [Rhodococcus sp.]|nr:hypothetical protein [Rhodococcus sp. (in: high G+C Gram-positive bacteria)]
MRDCQSRGSFRCVPRPNVNDRPDAPETIERDDKPRGDPEELTVTARRIEDEVSAACGSANATAAIMREELADGSAQRVRDVVRR